MTGDSEAGAVFDDLLRAVISAAGRFGHREHVHVTWLIIRRLGRERAAQVVGEGIRRTATYEGRPQKYHETMSHAWTRLIGHRMRNDSAGSFEQFAAANPDLFDKRLLTRFYTPSTLALPAARTSWVEPDRLPLPE